MNILRILCVASFLLISQKANSIDDDIIIPGNFDYRKLESKVLNLLNEKRGAQNMIALQPDSLLYLAANDQVKYMKKIGDISHRQTTPGKEKLRQRVEFYGGEFQGLGENTARIAVFVRSYQKNNSGQDYITTLDKYSTLAKALYNAWYFSPHHKTNMLYPKFNRSGISVVYSEKDHSVFAVQVFGYPYGP